MRPSSTGVFICHCGGNISDAIDISSIKQGLQREEVGLVKDVPYLCSDEGQELIKNCIKLKKLDRIVIAACSPNIHEHTFRSCARDSGLNPHMVDIANVREQCAWISAEDPTRRALDIIRSSVYAIQHAKPYETPSIPVVKKVAVIGGGIAGITAARSLGKMGIETCLIEKSPTIGGNMVKVGKVISPEKLSEDCAMCSLSPLMGELARDKHVEIKTLTRVVGCKGRAGEFTLELESGPFYVDPELCRSCSKCSDACKIAAPDEWNVGLSLRKAIYRPFSQSIPPSYVIDPEACNRCEDCVDTCVSHAIDLTRMVVKDSISVGAIVIATGHAEMDPSERFELGYGKYPEVLTQMELARLLAINGPTRGKLEINGEIPRRIIMVQCVGSRENKPGSIPYCSKICCIIAMKHANYIMEHNPGIEVIICYTDMRTLGTYESYYQEAQGKGLRLIRGRVSEVLKKGGDLMVRLEDTLGSEILDIDTDMVVLSCAILPSEGTVEIAKTLNVNSTPEYFIKEKHPKLEPGCTTSRGIFVCGTANGAKDITESIAQAQSTASKVAEMMLNSIEIEPDFATIESELCNRCGRCLQACPHGAIYSNGTVNIDPISCIGLGRCINSCPENAIIIMGNNDQELLARIDGCVDDGDPRIIAFLDRNIGYVAADNAGMNRVKYPSCVRIIRIPSVFRLNSRHLKHAFDKGIAGIFIGDGTVHASKGTVDDSISSHVDCLRCSMLELGIDPRRIYYYEAYLPHFKGMASRLDKFYQSIQSMEAIYRS
ncbi:MAG: hydrogenase iron-sulfur subunit [Methanomassiliicoccales archaeon]|nr:hydrogenase iron-sulfur subunit [Methanomassiliicoccales archaeon]NYT14394.1 hydrogenase iron-sulfur subunit [Methanomassiliicoccales archaeon]